MCLRCAVRDCDRECMRECKEIVLMSLVWLLIMSFRAHCAVVWLVLLHIMLATAAMSLRKDEWS